MGGRDVESLSEHGGYQDSSNGYVWPSNEYRLKVLSYSDSMLTPRLDFDMIAPSDDSKLQITTGARQNPIMGQHRISSFQVLVRHMTDIYIVQSSLKGAPPLTISEDCSSLTWDLMNGAIHRRTRPKVSKKDLAGSMTTSPMVKCQSKFYALWTHFDKPGTRTGQF